MMKGDANTIRRRAAKVVIENKGLGHNTSQVAISLTLICFDDKVQI